MENFRWLGLLEHAGAPAPASSLPGLIPARYRDAMQTCLRQRCLHANFSFMLVEISKHCVNPGVPLVLPLPKRWRHYLQDQGLNILARSRLRFIITIIDSLFAGLRTARQLAAAQNRSRMVKPPASDHHVFIAVGPDHLPDRSGQLARSNFHSWYREQFALEPQFPFVAQNSSVTEPVWYSEKGVLAWHYFPPLQGRIRLRFAFAAIRMSILATIATMLGKWWYALLLSEAVELSYSRHLPDNQLARRYVFHMGNCFVRPLWTYEVERRRSDVICVLYSGNFLTFSRDPDKSPPPYPGYASLSWSEIVCIDEQSRNALIKYGHKAETVTVSRTALDFHDDGRPVPTIPRPLLVVFDVTPYRPSFKALHGWHVGYYDAENWIRFVSDVAASATRQGFMVALKSKRPDNRNNPPSYRRFLESLESDTGVVIMHAGIPPSRALTIADAVVAMPFTSALEVAGRMGLPGVYYDPGGAVSHCSDRARGMSILTDRAALEEWLASIRGAVVSECRWSEMQADDATR